MITVLHLRDTDRVCGPGKTILETATAATHGEFHHVVGLLLLDSERSNDYLTAAVGRGVDTVPIRAATRFDPRIIATIIRVVKERRVDIIHSHDYKSDLLAWVASRFHRVPVMTTVHGWIWNNVRYRVYWRAAQTVLPRFDLVVAVSGQTRAAVLACGVKEEKLALIHNAIVAENYDPRTTPRGTVRERYGIPDDAKVVGCVGRLSAEKGQRDLLAAAAEVLRTHPGCWFLFVGDGPDRESLKSEVAAAGLAGRVVFTGHLQDVRPVFRDMDVLALPSHTEGFPNVILEALCMETPVLATDVGGVREIVVHRQTGLILPPHSPDRLAAGLRELLDDDVWAASLAAAGKAMVMREFTFRERVLKEEAACRQMLSAWRHE